MKVERFQIDIIDLDAEDFESLVELFQTLDRWQKARAVEKPKGVQGEPFEPEVNRQAKKKDVEKRK